MSSDVPTISAALAAGSSLSGDEQSLRAVTEIPQIVADEDDEKLTLSELLLNPGATSYYLSLLLHLVAYAVAAVVFTLLGHHLLDQDTVVPPIRASLDEFDRQDDRPQFEAVADINISPAKTESSIQRISNNLQAVENGLIGARPEDLVPSLASTENEGVDDGGSEFLFKIPESGLAVTKGSFTVWSEPEVPRPGEAYRLIVQVRLPSQIKAYRINDLSGQVIGSDKYEQNIPYDAKAPDALYYTDENLKEVKITNGSEAVKVRDNKIQLVILVPPARRLVKDTIRIRSRRLRERQELELVFGGR